MTAYTSGVFPAIEWDPTAYSTVWSTDISRTGHAYFKVQGSARVNVPNSSFAGGIKNPLTNTFVVSATNSTLPSGVALIRTSPVMPTPTLVGKGRPDPAVWIPSSITQTVIGWMQVIINNKDYTFFRNQQVEVKSIVEAEPFGSIAATLTFPQITIFEAFSSGNNLDWLTGNPNIEIYLCDISGTRIGTLFEGFVIEPSFVASSSDVSLTITCQGALYQADYIKAQPKLNTIDKSIEKHISDSLNFPTSRLSPMVSTATGITIRQNGSWESRLAAIQETLAHSTSDDGTNQYSLMLAPGRVPTLTLKDKSTVNWTVTPGTPGIDIDIKKDTTAAPTTIYGRGTAPDPAISVLANRGFANLKIPGYDPSGGVVSFCFSNPALYLTLGNTDATTTSGDGVTLTQRRLNTIGRRTTVNGTYDTATQKQITNFQANAGLLVDGLVGAQTWAALFAIGANASSWDQASYFPFAWNPATEPYLYNGDGSINKPNTGVYNPNILRVEKLVSMADGTSKKDTEAFLKKLLLRDGTAVWTGTIVLDGIDPEEGSRWAIKAGQNIKVKKLQGIDQLFHIVNVNKDFTSGMVTLTIDVIGRDLMTLDAIAQRKRDAYSPAYRSGAKFKQTQLASTNPVIDSELTGWIPKHSVPKNLWTVVQVPLGASETIVKVEIDAYVSSTSGAHANTSFCQAYFAGPVTPAWLLANIGDPNTYRADGTTAPFSGPESVMLQLAQMGWIDTLGMPGAIAGYWPYKYGVNGALPTGKERVNNLSKQFESFQPPYIWVATWSVDTAAVFQGRIYIAPTA
jgi:peptidoglycan hydrolase-like protein with peptidoglycan-binding domain